MGINGVFQDCYQPYFLALGNSGVYPIENGRRGYAYCDQSTDGGGWLVIARRAGGRRSFDKTWRHYKKGFGPLDKDFWLELDSIINLTNSSLLLSFVSTCGTKTVHGTMLTTIR